MTTPERKLIQMATMEGSQGVYTVLMDIAQKLDALAEDHQATRDMIENHMKGEEHLLKLFERAFPNGDPVGHCNWHEEEIDRIRSRKEFWKKMTFELAKWGLVGFLGWVVLQLWSGALKGPQ